jgi:endonuclease YncB( thermonuclease family)
MKKTMLILLAMMIGQAAFADILTGRVVKVADGDTITVLDASYTQHRIRLAGIDAPEKEMGFGQRSKQSLSNLVYGKDVNVLWEKKDGYGRIIGKVMVNGMDANLAQIQGGMAWHYKRYMTNQSISDRTSYSSEEETARKLRKGLWADKDPTPPWDWRHR